MTTSSKRRFNVTHVFGVIVFVGVVFSVGYALYREFGTTGPHITLTGDDLFQLRDGAPLKLKGVDVGRVVDIKFENERARVSVELTCSPETVARLTRDSTQFSIARFVNTELQWKDAQTVLHGSHIVAELGDPAQGPAQNFELRAEPPRDPRITWRSPRVNVEWAQLHGVSYGASVYANGQQVGCVDKISAAGQGITVQLAFFDFEEDKPCRFAVAGTQFYVKRFEGANLEVRGVDTLVKGTHVIVVPGDPQGEAVATFTGSQETPPDPRIRWDSMRCEIRFANLFALQVGGAIRCEGRAVGVIEDLVAAPQGADVRCAFFERNVSYASHGARFYISRFATERLEVQGVEATIRGPHIVVVPGTGEKLVEKHQGFLELPPHPLVRPDSPRMVVRWQNVQGLEARAPVLCQGFQVGEVESIGSARPGQTIDVGLVFFVDDQQYRAASNRFFVNVASIGARGVEGEASTVLKGPHVDLVLDPLGATNAVATIIGAEGAPPRYLPRVGESALVLESPVWVDAYVPLISRRQVVGYVLQCERATDNRSYFITARIYREGQELVKDTTVFFLPPKVRATLFSRDGWALQGPRVEVPDLQSFLQAGVEFRTPPDAGEQVVFAKSPRFRLHLEPEPAWLLWQDASTPAVHRVVLPEVVTAGISWRRGRIGFSTQHNGLAVPIGNTLLGPKEVLVTELTEGETEAVLNRCTFTVDGATVERAGGTFSVFDNGLARFTFKDAQAWKTNAAVAAAVPAGETDLLLVAPGQQISVDRRRLTVGAQQWTLEGADVPVSFHGAAAVVSDETSKQFGKIVGIVIVEGKQTRIVWVPKN